MHGAMSLILVMATAVTAQAAREPSAYVPADLVLVSGQDASTELTAPSTDVPGQTPHGPGTMFLLSLAVPGAGQIVQGEKRGYVYAAAEVAFWAGFLALNEQGLDERDDYEDYADAHWDYEGYSAWYDENCTECAEERANDYECRPLAVYGTQEYYEDIGKYDTYWRWWSYSGSGSDQPEYLDVRNEYWDMRGESNLHLRQARYSMTAAFLNHIVSAVDSFLSARRSAEGTGASAADAGASRLAAASPIVRFDAASSGAGLSCAFVVRY